MEVRPANHLKPKSRNHRAHPLFDRFMIATRQQWENLSYCECVFPFYLLEGRYTNVYSNIIRFCQLGIYHRYSGSPSRFELLFVCQSRQLILHRSHPSRESENGCGVLRSLRLELIKRQTGSGLFESLSTPFRGLAPASYYIYSWFSS